MIKGDNIFSVIRGGYIGLDLDGTVAGGGGGCTAVIGSEIQIGAGTSTSSSIPAYGLYDYSWFAGIWLDTEFTGGGERQITGIEVEVGGYANGYTYNNQNILLYHVTEDIFDSDPAIDLSDLTTSDETLCKSAFSWVVTSGTGFKSIDFDTNFCYNGTDNLLLVWENRDGSWQSGYGSGRYDFSPAISRAATERQDNIYPTGNGTRSNSRINIKFKY